MKYRIIINKNGFKEQIHIEKYRLNWLRIYKSWHKIYECYYEGCTLRVFSSIDEAKEFILKDMILPTQQIIYYP